MYIVFAGNTYYPKGGVYDLAKKFESLNEAKNYVMSLNRCDCDWYQIVDENLVIVERSDMLPFNVDDKDAPCDNIIDF